MLLRPPFENKRIQDLIENNQMEEELEENYKVSCPYCTARHGGVDQRNINRIKEIIIIPEYNIPKLLFIYLSRFENQGVGAIKNNTKVILDEVINVNEQEYNLSSIIYHSGTLEGGHYICCIKFRDNNYYLFNDDKIVSMVERDHVLSGVLAGRFTPYILLYVHKGEDNFPPLDIQGAYYGGGSKESQVESAKPVESPKPIESAGPVEYTFF
jgi:ubiquitin C-terminal hydrolase